ncbi:GGDEF domain-containing protein [Vibrio sp. Y2-5]|uniref:GGDEF domain-containing protein n=1 Tax=Vibrio sp. Y2-5 TaxID=2743977 RepID=UPI001660A50E|nr:GGDEF domain-containing protein [Vibrio sp. Y2-5]MBD0788393.1 GGDEF domain-containing protein [Vibrio sp. Y2-5]
MKRYIKISVVALLVSTFLFFLVVGINMGMLVDAKFSRVDSIVKTIEIKKQKMILLGLLAETERQLPVLVKDEDLNDYEVYSYAVKGHEELTENERTIIRVMQLSNKYVPSLFNSNDGLMYFRSYEGRKIFTHEWIPDFPISEELLGFERCRVTETCSIYARPFQLIDRIIVSPIYKDLLTNSYIISLSSPVRDFTTKEIIGDFVVDFQIPVSWDNGLKFRTEKNKSFKSTIFEHANFNFGRIYTREHVTDNRSKIIYKVSASNIAIELLWLWGIFYICSFFVYWKWADSHYSRNQLKEVLISANEDELTGLYNRKIFKEDEFLSATSNKKASVIAIDGNKIKKINDLFGHAAGDKAIRRIADSMKTVFGSDGYLVRNGGDEFIVILPDCELNAAEALASELKNEVHSSMIEPTNIRISVATGVAEKLEYESIETAILCADENLYRDKEKLSSFR